MTFFAFLTTNHCLLTTVKPGRCGVSPLERVESDEVRTRGKLPPLYYGLLLPKEDNSTKATNCQVSYSFARNDAGWILSPLTGLQNDILSVHNKFLRFSCAIPNH